MEDIATYRCGAAGGAAPLAPAARALGSWAAEGWASEPDWTSAHEHEVAARARLARDPLSHAAAEVAAGVDGVAEA